MKKKFIFIVVIISLLLVGDLVLARTSYWGEYEEQINENLRRPSRTIEDFTTTLSEAVDTIALDSRWTGTRKEAHDLFRNYIAIAMGVTPPANWDANVSDAQDAAVEFMSFLDAVQVNGNILTEASKISILDFARTNAEFEPSNP